MNENIDLTKILKNCPKGTKFHSPLFGEVKFDRISYGRIIIECIGLHLLVTFNQAGRYLIEVSENNTTYYSSECLLFPSKDQRDWSKFTAPWLKKEKFDPKTLKPFDKILVKCTSIYNSNLVWRIGLFSYFYVDNNSIRVYILGSDDNSPKSCVIPYNDDTKHLVNTEIEAPEFYRYWED